jgi:hypothetical protein
MFRTFSLYCPTPSCSGDPRAAGHTTEYAALLVHFLWQLQAARANRHETANFRLQADGRPVPGSEYTEAAYPQTIAHVQSSTPCWFSKAFAAVQAEMHHAKGGEGELPAVEEAAACRWAPAAVGASVVAPSPGESVSHRAPRPQSGVLTWLPECRMLALEKEFAPSSPSVSAAASVQPVASVPVSRLVGIELNPGPKSGSVAPLHETRSNASSLAQVIHPPAAFRCCDVCNRPTRLKCSLCFQAHYCSKECQIGAWRQKPNSHRFICEALRLAKCATAQCHRTAINFGGSCLVHAPEGAAVDIHSPGFSCFQDDWPSPESHTYRSPFIVHTDIWSALLSAARVGAFPLIGSMFPSVADAVKQEGASAWKEAVTSKFQYSPFLRSVLLRTGLRPLSSRNDAPLAKLLMELRNELRQRLKSDGRLECDECELELQTEADMASHWCQHHLPALLVCSRCQQEKASSDLCAAQISVRLGACRFCEICETQSHSPSPAIPDGEVCAFYREDLRWNGFPGFVAAGDVMPCPGPDTLGHADMSSNSSSPARPWQCDQCDLCSACTFPVVGHRSKGGKPSFKGLLLRNSEPVQTAINTLKDRFSASAQHRLKGVRTLFLQLSHADEYSPPLRKHTQSADGNVHVGYLNRDHSTRPSTYAVKYPKMPSSLKKNGLILKEALLMFLLSDPRYLGVPNLARVNALVHDHKLNKWGSSMACVPPHIALGHLNNHLDAGTRMQITTQIARSLTAMHEAGVAHCDLHGGNILLTRRQEVVIIDLGRHELLDKAHARRDRYEDVNKWKNAV